MNKDQFDQFIKCVNNPPENKISKLCVNCVNVYYENIFLQSPGNLCYKCRKDTFAESVFITAWSKNNLFLNDTSMYKCQSSWEDYEQCCVAEIEKNIKDK